VACVVSHDHQDDNKCYKPYGVAHARMHHTDCRDSVMKTEMKTAHQTQTRIREPFSEASVIGPRLLPRPKVTGAGRTSHADDGVPSLEKRGERGERRKILGRLTVMAVAVQLIQQVHILFSGTYIQYYAVPSPCRAIWCAQAQGEGWQAISVETGVAVVRDRDRCGAPGITAGGMGLPSCHIHQKALGSLRSLRSAFLFPSPLLHLADSFPAQPKKPLKSRERA